MPIAPVPRLSMLIMGVSVADAPILQLLALPASIVVVAKDVYPNNAGPRSEILAPSAVPTRNPPPTWRTSAGSRVVIASPFKAQNVCDIVGRWPPETVMPSPGVNPYKMLFARMVPVARSISVPARSPRTVTFLSNVVVAVNSGFRRRGRRLFIFASDRLAINDRQRSSGDLSTKNIFEKGAAVLKNARE